MSVGFWSICLWNAKKLRYDKRLQNYREVFFKYLLHKLM
jgi:hypothetical protein